MGTGHRGRAGGLAAYVLVALYGGVCALGLVVIASVYIGFAVADGCRAVLAIELVVDRAVTTRVQGSFTVVAGRWLWSLASSSRSRHTAPVLVTKYPTVDIPYGGIVES
jgi:hypothetical protein